MLDNTFYSDSQSSIMAQQMMLQRTPLYSSHVDSGAKMVEFGGWDMPLQFTKVLEEHHAVRIACGLFDISHMGILSVSSGNIEATLQALNYLIPQDLTKIYPGKAVYTQLLNEEAGIIDDIIVYWMPPVNHFPQFSEFMVICNAANTEKVLAWMKRYLPDSVQLDYLNSQYSLLALQGPLFEKVLNAGNLQPQNALPKRFHIGEFSLGGSPVLLSRTGYTGEDGVEILVIANQAEMLWKQLLQNGVNFGLKSIGLAARDTLRLEAAYPLHGAELSETITPLEAGLEWSVKLDQPQDFIGKSALLVQKADGLKRQFVCLEVLQRSIPRPHDVIYDLQGNPIGEITSGSISPTLNKPIGVGYVNSSVTLPPETLIRVGIRTNLVDAKVVERPFYRK